MTVTASTLLSLPLITTGTESGVWGSYVNNGLTSYLDNAIAGTVTLTGDGAVTLSNTAGTDTVTNIVSSLTGAGTVSAQFAIIRVTGTLTTAKILTAPSSSREYIVVNAATGSTVTIKASGQSGVSVAVGESATVYFNGTDYVKSATTTSGSGSVTSVAASVPAFLSVAGSPITTSGTLAITYSGTALPVANGGTGLTSGTSGGVLYYSATGTLASSAALTANALVLGGGAGATPAPLASLGTTTTVLHGNASGAPTFSAVSLTADITGTLSAANGGTGVANNAAMTVTGSGNFAYTRTLTGATNVTFPTTGTLAISSAAQTFTGGQRGAVTALTSSAASIAINLATNNNFSYTTVENSTLAAPSNAVAGQSGIITITQGATPRTLAYNSFYKFAGGTVPTLTATAGAVDAFAYYVESASRATCQLIKDVK